jgi:hypothetical protein
MRGIASEWVIIASEERGKIRPNHGSLLRFSFPELREVKPQEQHGVPRLRPQVKADERAAGHYQTYRDARTITMIATAVAKPDCKPNLLARLWLLSWLCIVMSDDLLSGRHP